MYCRKCGNIVDNTSLFCNNCGARLDDTSKPSAREDNSSFGFAVLGFFIPIIGLVLFLIYEGTKPKRAKSAGTGALIGFICKIVLSIIIVILYVVFASSLFSEISNDIELNIPGIRNVYRKESTEEILDKYVDVSFGEFKVTNNGYFPETSLDITVKNKADKQCTYFITIEAVDSNGARIDTDMVYADRLCSGQEIYLTAFKFVEQEKLNQFKNANFRVLEINKYDC